MKKRGGLFLKKIFSSILDFLEIYLPSILFVSLFIVFLLQIFFRYFLVPLTWTLEFILIAFIWITLFGACYAQRDNSHIQFTLVYERKIPRTQTWIRIVGNSLVINAFLLALYPSFEYISFMSFKKSSVLKIPMSIAFSPFIIFLIIMIWRLASEIYNDVTKLTRREI